MYMTKSVVLQLEVSDSNHVPSLTLEIVQH